MILFLFLQLDDWVLCRIYKKSHALPPSAIAAASNDHDQEEEEEQIVQETVLPSLKSPISNKTQLMPQKSSSFSNLLDAMDFSILSSFLSDTQFNTNGCEPNPTLTSSAAFDEPFFNNNCNPTSNSSSSNSYLLQKLPQLNTSMSNMENKLKRQLSNIDEDMLHPSKKLINSCSFTNSNTAQTDHHMAQYNFLNQPFLNQQLLLSPHFQFQG